MRTHRPTRGSLAAQTNFGRKPANKYFVSTEKQFKIGLATFLIGLLNTDYKKKSRKSYNIS